MVRGIAVMPILMTIDSLKPGMVLAANLINGYTVLLPHGRKLNSSDISSLRKRCSNLSVQIVDPLLDKTVEFDDTSHDAEVSLEVRSKVSKVANKVSSQLRSGVALDDKQLAGMQSEVEKMMAYLSENPVTVAMIEQSSNWDDFLQEHSANVFYLSMLLGNTLRNYVKRERERLSAAKKIRNAMNLTPLGTAAMFHDMGMSAIEHVYRKTEPLTEQELGAIRNHPVKGADMLPDSVNPMVKLIIRTHHENYDGSGYPAGLLGSKINIFSRIIRVADSYTAATDNRVYKQAKNPVTVVYEMACGDYKNCYDPIIRKVFIGMIQPLPIGSKLKLADGRTVVVVRHNHTDCFKPTLIIAFDEFGDPLDKEALEPPFVFGQRDDVQVTFFGETDISMLNGLDMKGLLEDSVEELGTDNKNEGDRELAGTFDFAYP